MREIDIVNATRGRRRTSRRVTPDIDRRLQVPMLDRIRVFGNDRYGVVLFIDATFGIEGDTFRIPVWRMVVLAFVSSVLGLTARLNCINPSKGTASVASH